MTIREGLTDLFDTLTTRQVLMMIGAAVLLLSLAVALGSAASWYKIRSLEKDVAAAKERADALATKADAKEKEAAKYEEKIAFLESGLTQIQSLARTQDENLQRFSSVVVGARADAERASRVRSINSTADELCQRLYEVGHPCEP